MLKLIPIATTILCLSYICNASSNADKHTAEILVSAGEKISVVSKTNGTSAVHASWLGVDAPKNISATKTAFSDKWTPMGLSVMPTADGYVDIILRSCFARDANRKVLENRTLFRNLVVDGVKYGSDELKSPDGSEVTYSKKISVPVKAQNGKPLSISVEMKVPDRWYGTKTIDLTKHANMPADGSKGALTPMKNLPVGETVLGGMKYDFVNPEKTGGKRAAHIAYNSPLSVDLGGENVRGKYLYVLAASSNDLNYTDHANCNLVIHYKNGISKNFWIRKDREFGTSKDAPKPATKGIPVYVDDKEKNTGVLYFTQLTLKNDSPIDSITISGEKLNVFAITLSNEFVSSTIPHKYDMSQWRVVDMSDLAVKDGSALDVSEGIGKPKAGRYGRVVISKDGHFEFEKMPGKKVKFKGTNWRPGDMFGRTAKTHADIDELAKMMRKQGYNLVRWRLSMNKNEFAAPYVLKEYNKDMYDYFFYAMAREGVYSHFNLSSHDLGNPDFEWGDRYDVKIKMFFGDTQTREDWRKLVKMQLNLVNKYTGKKWKDDLSIATTEYYNEIELGPVDMKKASPQTKKFVDEKFVAFLKRKYGTFENWNEPEWKKRFNLKSFDDVKFSNAVNTHHDVAHFLLENGREMQKFCETVVRNEEGFKPPLHQHNVIRTTPFALLSAEAGDYIALNVYHNHPSAFMDIGSYVGHESSISNFARYFRATAAKRVAGRPMMLSEWQHCHWNPRKYEGGIVMPAYAALQDFDNLTVHDVAVLNTQSPLGPFEVARSPVFRANEFLSYVLFYRGDVKKSPSRVDLVYDKDYIENSKNFGNAMNDEQSKIALMTGFATDFPSARETPMVRNIRRTPASLKIKPVGYSETWSSNNFASSGSGDKKFDISEMTETLRKKGILPKENISDPSKGVFQSDTGEITMRVPEELIKVVTPNTEAVALTPATKNEKLGLVTVKSTSEPAAFAVTSVDGKPLSKSRRMVVIYNTDNISTGFEVSRDMCNLVSRGRTPILMKVGKVSATIKLPEDKGGILARMAALFGLKRDAPTYSLYALKITGERLEKIPVEIKDGMINIELDTSKLKEFSPFFELAAE